MSGSRCRSPLGDQKRSGSRALAAWIESSVTGVPAHELVAHGIAFICGPVGVGDTAHEGIDRLAYVRLGRRHIESRAAARRLLALVAIGQHAMVAGALEAWQQHVRNPHRILTVPGRSGRRAAKAKQHRQRQRWACAVFPPLKSAPSLVGRKPRSARNSAPSALTLLPAHGPCYQTLRPRQINCQVINSAIL